MNDIYKIRERGQVVNEACQWIAGHRRLAISLAVRPVLILTALEIINILFVESILLSLLLCLIALLLVPTIPSIMMYIVENDVPWPCPMSELWRLWKSYFASALLIGVIGTVASLLCSVTMVGPVIVEMVQDVVLVVHQRNRDDGMMSAISRAFSLSFTNFPSLMLMILGKCIITFSMIFGPYSILFLIYELTKSVIPPSFNEVLRKMMTEEAEISFMLTVVVVGYVFASMISIIIAHFFYGHCIACEDQREAIRQERRKRREEANKA